jgi:hypothetical protein
MLLPGNVTASIYRKLSRLTDGLVHTCRAEVPSLQCERATPDVRAGHGPRDPAVECGAGVANGCGFGRGSNHIFGKECQEIPRSPNQWKFQSFVRLELQISEGY